MTATPYQIDIGTYTNINFSFSNLQVDDNKFIIEFRIPNILRLLQFRALSALAIYFHDTSSNVRVRWSSSTYTFSMSPMTKFVSNSRVLIPIRIEGLLADVTIVNI